MEKYLALRHGAQTSLHSVHTPWPQAKYFPIRPSYVVNKYEIILLPGMLKQYFRESMESQNHSTFHVCRHIGVTQSLVQRLQLLTL